MTSELDFFEKIRFCSDSKLYGTISLTLVGCPAGGKGSYLDSNDLRAGFFEKISFCFGLKTVILEAKSATGAASSVNIKSK